MSRIDSIFSSLRADGRPALMPFLTAGHPSLEATRGAIPALEAAGASIIELGFPFSDPVADGPVIAASMQEALSRGVTPAGIFDLVASVRERTALGLIAMVSASIVNRMGPSSFIAQAAEAGFDGFIIPDIDLEAADEVIAEVESRDLAFALLVAPNSPPERIAEIVRRCRGFVYVLARVGITGERGQLMEIEAHIRRVREQTDLPLAVGFGISSAAQVAQVTAHADAAIVGSALVRRMAEASDPVAAAAAFVAELAQGLPRHRGSRTS